MIDARNAAEKGTAQHGITKFADLTVEEFRVGYLNYHAGHFNVTKTRMIGSPKPLDLSTAKSSDWTGTYTTPVKDQGYCGSCWAFSVTEQIESDWMRTGDGSAPVLSAQQVTSCTSYRLPGVGGCNGGKPESGYTYAEAGLVLDSDYPYTSGQRGETGDCDVSQAGRQAGRQADSRPSSQGSSQLVVRRLIWLMDGKAHCAVVFPQSSW